MNTLHSSNKQPQPVTFSGLHIYGKVNKFQFHATLFVFTLKEVIKYRCFFNPTFNNKEITSKSHSEVYFLKSFD